MTLSEKLVVLFSKEEIDRIIVSRGEDGQTLIVVDVHGMRTHEANRFINNLINIAQTKFNLIVIHGYNHGTAIKNMLETHFSNPHVVNKHVDLSNPGRTHLCVA